MLYDWLIKASAGFPTLSNLCVLTLGACCPQDPSQHKNPRGGVVDLRGNLKSSGPTIFLQSSFASPFPPKQSFHWCYILLVMANKDYFFRFSEKIEKGTIRVLLGRKCPLLKKKSWFLVLGGGVPRSTFFLFEEKKRQVLARSLLFALELTSGMDAR